MSAALASPNTYERLPGVIFPDNSYISKGTIRAIRQFKSQLFSCGITAEGISGTAVSGSARAHCNERIGSRRAQGRYEACDQSECHDCQRNRSKYQPIVRTDAVQQRREII